MKVVSRRFYQFGSFRIDAEKRVLLRDGEVVPLKPKAFDTLLILVQHHGEVLEKDALMDMLWPDSDVEESNLAQHISALRKALGESPNERRYIVTVPGRGYRFAAEITQAEEEPAEVVVARYTKATVVVHEKEASQTLEPEPATRQLGIVRQRSPKTVAVFAIALVVLLASAVALYLTTRKKQPISKEIHSVAILPFTSDDPATEYLSDGIADSLTNSLSQLSKLKVIARIAAYQYKANETAAQTLGQDLDVDAIVTGKVTQQGDTLVVQTDLISTTDGAQIWGARYSRKLSDIFSMQEALAREIAENLRFKLTPEEQHAVFRRYTENLKAYQNYLLGRSYVHRGSRDDFLTAISYYEKAIKEEPNYALAYSALTDAYASLTIRGFIDPIEGRRKAEEYARMGLFLDPNLAEAHANMGEIRVHFAPFDFVTGDQELRRAIELNPNLGDAYLYSGVSFLQQGRIDEGIKAWQKARELDPVSAKIARTLAYGYLLKRDYSKAMELLQQSADMAPPFSLFFEAELYLQSGKLAEALVELEKVKRERKSNPILLTTEGMLNAALGKRSEALRVIEELQRLPDVGMSKASWIAKIYAVMKEKEQALNWLERGLQAGAIPHFFKDSPIWDAIRDDPRFKELLRLMGVPQ